MTRKTLTPIALGFAAILTLGACGGGDEDGMDTGMADTGMAMPAPAPAPAPMTPDTMADTTMRDTTMRDTTPPPPPSN
jgi:hypothetical protein